MTQDKAPVAIQSAIEMAERHTINVKSKFHGHSVVVSKEEFTRIWRQDIHGWLVDYYYDENSVNMSPRIGTDDRPFEKYE